LACGQRTDIGFALAIAWVMAEIMIDVMAGAIPQVMAGIYLNRQLLA
jgi:hypothetical protein